MVGARTFQGDEVDEVSGEAGSVRSGERLLSRRSSSSCNTNVGWLLVL